jgi:plasmid stabilization system protein ParE
MGKQNEEIPVPGVHRFVMGSYLVDYEVATGEVLVFAIRHERERPPALKLEEDFDLEDPD